MTIAPLDIVLLLGSLQGFILGIMLWTNAKGNRLSNRLLATLIGLLALMSFAVGIPVLNKWVSFALDLLPLIIVMPLGPLIYFYVKSVFDPAFLLGESERRHFYPVVVDLGAKLVGWVFVVGVLLGVINESQGPSFGNVMDEYNTYVDIPRWISVTVYLVITRRLLNQYVIAGKSVTGEQKQLDLRWIRQFVHVFLIFQVIWFVHLVPYIIPEFRNALLASFGWYPIYIPLAILIYWLGFKGYLYTRMSVSVTSTPKSISPELAKETIEQVVAALSKAMQVDTLYLDPNLTTDKLGQQLQLSPKLISAVLNQHIGKNVNGFVNEYRVDEVKRRLTNPVYEHLTLTGIAFDCGFNSQATFQRAFKLQTGMSPGEYVARQKKNATQIGI